MFYKLGSVNELEPLVGLELKLKSNMLGTLLKETGIWSG
jgi:hypothetical protein